MSHFTSHRAFHDFASAVRLRRRFIPDSIVSSFTAGVRKTAAGREMSLRKGVAIYRAQIGSDWHHEEDPDQDLYIDETVPLSPERMIPDANFVGDGRANPHGIAYMYAASDEDTAIAEVRPWVGAEVSVAQFETLADLRVINCAAAHDKLNIHFDPPPKDRWDELVWIDIDRAFARPVSPNDSAISYLPTQILAELFLDLGFDGLHYKSALGDGYNLTIFNLEKVKLVTCALFAVHKVHYETHACSNPYRIRPADPGEEDSN